MKQYDAIVIGAGASGLFCAGLLGQKGKNVLVIDMGKKIGRKILISGGGNCNFTNYDVSSENYICSNKHFVKSALNQYTNYDFLAKVSEYQIDYYEKELGQLFCTNGAKEIVSMLKQECKKSNKVTFLLRNQVQKVRKEEDSFFISTSSGEFSSNICIVATGGLSMAGLGVSPIGYQIAKDFGISATPLRASLVPFTYLQKDEDYKSLAGISLTAEISCNNKSFINALLFTHRGISGPAILQISNYYRDNQSLYIDFLPSANIEEIIIALKKKSPKMSLKNALITHLPKKLIELWLDKKLFVNKNIADISNKDTQNLIKLVHRFEFKPNGVEGYKNAEVTLGGVDTNFISSKTMMAKTVENLYFIGEVLDVTGHLGGYNFQWAWSSAFACANSIN